MLKKLRNKNWATLFDKGDIYCQDPRIAALNALKLPPH